MKKIILLLISFLAFNLTYSQTDTRGFSFQGYAVDPDGKAIGSAGITVKFSIHPNGSATNDYTEEITLSTDAFGVFTAIIGSQAPDDFKKLNFSSVIYNLKVEVKKTNGGVYTTISDAQLLSVPYARSASNGVPVGTIISFGGTLDKMPDGWLLCDGRQLDGTDPKYKQLFNVIGTSWGGSGNNFYLPELRGWFLRGLDPGNSYDPDAPSRTALVGGGNTGNKVGSYQGSTYGWHDHPGTTTTNGAHTHIFYGKPNNGYNGYTASYNGSPEVFRAGTEDPNTSSAGDHSHSVSTDGRGGNETRPRNAAVYYIIKY
jgi:microcystin-dependent protein